MRQPQSLGYQGQCLFEFEQDVGWDQRRFAALAHQQFSKFPDGGPALEASWSHPTLKKAMALLGYWSGGGNNCAGLARPRPRR